MLRVIAYLLIIVGALVEWGPFTAGGLPPETPWVMLAAGVVLAAWDARNRDSRMFPVIVVSAIIGCAALVALHYSR